MKRKQMIHKLKIGALILLTAACMGCAGKEADEKTSEEFNKLIEWNLEEDYPEEPVEMVQLYCSITKEIHAKDISKEQIEQLLKQMRLLFDDELLTGNPYQDHLDKMTKEVNQYHKDKMVITRYTVEEADQVETYIDEEGNECGIVDISYSIKKDSQWLKSNEQIIIRKDSDEQWKILGNRTAP